MGMLDTMKPTNTQDTIELICSSVIDGSIKSIDMVYMVSINIINDGDYSECDEPLEVSLISDKTFELPVDDENFNEALHKYLKCVEVYEEYINRFNKFNGSAFLDSAFEVTLRKKDGTMEVVFDVKDVIKN